MLGPDVAGGAEAAVGGVHDADPVVAARRTRRRSRPTRRASRRRRPRPRGRRRSGRARCRRDSGSQRSTSYTGTTTVTRGSARLGRIPNLTKRTYRAPPDRLPSREQPHHRHPRRSAPSDLEPDGLPAQGALRRRRRPQRHQHAGRASCSYGPARAAARGGADESNPKGFGEPQWVVDHHDRLLKDAGVQVSDARPDAWFETGRVVDPRARADPHRRVARRPLRRVNHELVVKDPRLSLVPRPVAGGGDPRRCRPRCSRPCCGRRPRWSAASRSTTPTGSARRTSRPAGSTCCCTPSAPRVSPWPTAAASSSATATCSTTGSRS